LKWPPKSSAEAPSPVVLPGRGALRAFRARLSSASSAMMSLEGKWRIGAVREREAAGGAGKIESDLILADAVVVASMLKHRIEAERIRE